MAFAVSTAAWIGAGAAVAGIGANLYTSSKASKAQQQAGRDANNTQLRAQDQSIAFQKEQNDLARQDRAPWMQAGTNALAEMGRRGGAGGDLSREFNAGDMSADTGYQFRLAEGTKTMNNSAAARGGLLSGAALKAAGAYGQGMASQEYGAAYGRFKDRQDTQYNRLASIAGVGQTSAGQNASDRNSLGSNVGGAYIGTAGQVAQNQMGMGNARASGYLAGGNALMDGVNQGISAWKSHTATGNPLSSWNMYSGGNDGYTLPNGESLGS